MVNYHNFPQGSEEWREFRKGKITGTSSWRLLQGETPATIIQDSYKEEGFSGNAFTERGNILEAEARNIFKELNPDKTVSEVGAITNDKFPNCSASPDFLIDENGGGEIKSFNPDHMEDVWKNLDAKIISQIMWNLLLSEREYWVLILFNPDLDPKDAYRTKTFYPDKEIFAKFEQALTANYDDACVQETSLTILKLEQELQAQNEALKAQLEIRDALNQQILELKERLKNSTSGKIKQEIQVGEDTLSLSIFDSHKVKVQDPTIIPKDYLAEEEITERVFSRDDKIYRYVPNTKLAQTMVKAGKSLPPGFIDSISRSISIKFNGKAI